MIKWVSTKVRKEMAWVKLWKNIRTAELLLWGLFFACFFGISISCLQQRKDMQKVSITTKVWSFLFCHGYRVKIITQKMYADSIWIFFGPPTYPKIGRHLHATCSYKERWDFPTAGSSLFLPTFSLLAFFRFLALFFIFSEIFKCCVL